MTERQFIEEFMMTFMLGTMHLPQPAFSAMQRHGIETAPGWYGITNPQRAAMEERAIYARKVA